MAWLPGGAVADVFGADDRVDVPPDLASIARGVGLLTNDTAKTVCTMFCVAPAVAATAAHCLDPSGEGGPTRLPDARFSVPPHGAGETSRIAGARTSHAAQNVTTGQLKMSSQPTDHVAANDWALVKLERPICAGRVLAIDRFEMGADRRVAHVAYHSDRSLEAPAAVVDCRLWRTAETGSLALHDCDTGGASSGSPIVVMHATGPHVVAVNIGVYRRSRVVVRATSIVAHDADAAIANAAVDMVAVTRRLDVFEHSRMLSTTEQVKRLQRALSAGGWFRSSISGAYSAALGSAIARYEAATGQVVSGLATLDLLTTIERTSR